MTEHETGSGAGAPFTVQLTIGGTGGGPKTTPALAGNPVDFYGSGNTLVGIAVNKQLAFGSAGSVLATVSSFPTQIALQAVGLDYYGPWMIVQYLELWAGGVVYHVGNHGAAARFLLSPGIMTTITGFQCGDQINGLQLSLQIPATGGSLYFGGTGGVTTVQSFANSYVNFYYDSTFRGMQVVPTSSTGDITFGTLDGNTSGVKFNAGGSIVLQNAIANNQRGHMVIDFLTFAKGETTIIAGNRDNAGALLAFSQEQTVGPTGQPIAVNAIRSGDRIDGLCFSIIPPATSPPT